MQVGESIMFVKTIDQYRYLKHRKITHKFPRVNCPKEIRYNGNRILKTKKTYASILLSSCVICSSHDGIVLIDEIKYVACITDIRWSDDFVK